jgi:hypothetical protein
MKEHPGDALVVRSEPIDNRQEGPQRLVRLARNK